MVSRQFVGVLDIEEVFVVGDNGDRVRGSLDVLFSFLKCEDDGKEFTIIDVIVLFCRDKCLREIGAWV